MADSRVKDISSLLSRFFDRDTMSAGGKYVEFLGAWRQIAGPRLGDHSRPVDVRKGILIVEAEHSGWIQLLQMRQEQIVQTVRQRYPELEVRAMAVKLTSNEGLKPLPGEEAVSAARERAETGTEPERRVEVSTGTSGAGSPVPGRTEPPPELKDLFERLRKNLKE